MTSKIQTSRSSLGARAQSAFAAAWVITTPVGCSANTSGLTKALLALETTHRRHLALLERLLGALDTVEEIGLGGKNLPFLPKGNGVLQDGLAVTSQLVPSGVGAHESDTAGKGCTIFASHEVDADKVLVGLQDNFLTVAEIHSVDALLARTPVRLDVVDSVAADLGGELLAARAKDSVDPVASHVTAHDLESVITDLEKGRLNVRPAEADLAANVNVHALVIVELGVAQHDHVARTMKVVLVVRPSLEVRVTATTRAGRQASQAVVAVDESSVAGTSERANCVSAHAVGATGAGTIRALVNVHALRAVALANKSSVAADFCAKIPVGGWSEFRIVCRVAIGDSKHVEHISGLRNHSFSHPTHRGSG